MAFFPQLRTGALAQYPVTRRIVHRTAESVHADGSGVRLADPGWTHLEWRLTYSGLDEEEKNAIQGLFFDTEGRLGAFTFPDPWANLLAWSEDLGNEAWARDAAIECGFHDNDPFGGTLATAVLNGGAERQAIRQAVALPAVYRCCFSVYVRAQNDCEVVLFREAGAERAEAAFAVSDTWRRLEHSTALSGVAPECAFGLALDPGSEVTVFGWQAEVQVKAGPYRRTTTDAGIYTNAHFDHDTLEITAASPGAYGAAVRVRARREAAS